MPFLRHARTGIGIEWEDCMNPYLAVNVSITEEPGAGIPHAGICAGCIR